MIFNMVGGGGGSSTKSTIIVSIETGSTVGIYDSTYTTLIKSASEKTAGEYWLTGLNNGTYYLKATKGSDVATTSYTISEYGVYRISMAYSTIPTFTYTGDYELVTDDDMETTSAANWKIRFLTSGTFRVSQFNGVDEIDIFAVGAGAACQRLIGGSGGYTNTVSGQTLAIATDYAVTVGAGAAGSSGGASSFGSLATANGGVFSTSNSTAVSGGSGGGYGYNANTTGGNGGCDGCAGTSTTDSATAGRGGQGTTTREFGGYTNTISASVSGGNAFVLSNEPTATEKAFLVSGKYITVERSGVTRVGIQDVFPILSYDDATRVVTVDTTYQTVTASSGDTVRFGNLYASGGPGAGWGASITGRTSYTYAFGLTGSSAAAVTVQDNFGDGGNAYDAHDGGSGIVIIRNARS